MRALDIWYARLDADQFRREWDAGATKGEKKRFERDLAKSRTKDSMKAFDKLTRLVDGEPRIIADPPLIVPIDDLLGSDEAQAFVDAIRVIIRSYRRSLPADRRLLLERFRYVDCARKVVGVGSVGTRAWVVLMVGNDGDDPLFLQIKEAEASVLERFLGKSKFANHGQRVVEGQRLMQTASDIMLGWIRTPGTDGVTRDFYIRQLWDGKGSALIEAMTPRGLRVYAEVCAWTLARAHARSGRPGRHRRLPRAEGRFDRALASFAETYADQNERDFAALRAAVDSGRITARTRTCYGRGVQALSGAGDLGEDVALGGARSGLAAARAAQHERAADREGGAGDRPGDIDPVVGEVPADEVGPEGAGRVHRRPRDRAAPQPGEGDVAADAEGADDADVLRARRRAQDHAHQPQREDATPSRTRPRPSSLLAG